MTGGPPEAPALTLVSHPLCPYVQRAAIVLAEKGVPVERRYIDLDNKPDWFRAISPLGKVPLLLVRRDGGEVALFESAVICDYLEETQAGPRLHPADPLDRARHRGWIEFASSILADLWGLETATDASSCEARWLDLAEKFARVEPALTGAPYFGGTGFCVVDAAFAPIFRYFDLFEAMGIAGGGDLFAGTPRLRAWRTALAARPSVAGAVPADYARRLQAFLVDRNAHLLKTGSRGAA